MILNSKKIIRELRKTRQNKKIKIEILTGLIDEVSKMGSSILILKAIRDYRREMKLMSMV